ncbi:MAG: hypothetical protein D6737_08410 [Chloroflexi bacterium]|nr:MAG: hypothetical protein D6737_08410 [Chloroflexota bacterium]
MTTFRNHTYLSIATIIALVMGVVIVIAFIIAPGTSTVEVASCLTTGVDGQACIRFPSVRGANLNTETRNLPDDFSGAFNLVVVSFEEEQTERAVDWLPTAEALQTQYENFAFYNVPVLPASIPAPIRLVINAGLIAAIPDEMLREISVVLFLEDVDEFTAALDITSRDELAVLLLNDVGEVVWRESGDFTAAKGAALGDEMRQRTG